VGEERCLADQRWGGVRIKPWSIYSDLSATDPRSFNTDTAYCFSALFPLRIKLFQIGADRVRNRV
jgi:hypothetical protein